MNKRIIIISSEFPPGPGGIGQHAYSLARALQSEGFSIEVLTPGDYADVQEVQAFDLSQTFLIKRYPRVGLLSTYWKRLYITLAALRENPTNASVILTGKFSLWQGYMIKVIYPRLRTIAILHGSEINLSNKFLRRLTHAAIAAADVVVPVSQFTRSLLPQKIQNKHNLIKIIPNGIDYDYLTIKNTQHLKLEGFPKLLTVGHVTPRKGQHRVIKAIPLLLEKFPYLHYHIVGRPHSIDKLTALAIDLNVDKHITFHGRVPEHEALNDYYSQADVFMLLSENQPDGDVEGFGIVALEANIHGLPVVGAKNCGVEEAVSHLESGYIVDGDNPKEILEGIQYCISNNEKLKEGTKIWAEKHKWSEIVKKYIALFQ